MTVWIAKTGDIARTMYLRVTWPTDAPTTVQPSAGTAMIDRVELSYKDQLIERIYGENLYMLGDTRVPQAKQLALSTMVGTSTTSNLASYHIPMHFSILEKGLPLIALDEAPKFRVVFKPSTFFTSGPVYTKPIQVDLFVEYVYVTQAERDYLTSHELIYTTESFQRMQFRVPPSATQSSVQFLTSFVNDVKELYWVIQSDDASNVYNYSTQKTSLTGFTALDGASTDNSYSITTDSSGNIYVTGFYTSTGAVSINNLALNSSLVSSGYTLPATSGNDMFILKYNSSGTLVAFTALNGTGSDAGYGITTDSSGNMYVTGQYTSSGTVTVNNMALNSSLVSSGYTLPATTGIDMFILKYNSSGTLIAFTALNGTGSDIGYGITTDSSGNMYVTGQYTSSGTVTINNMALNSSLVSSGYTLPAATSNDIFILKYNSSGTLVAFTALKGTGSDIGYSITTDSSGNMYVTGQYTSSGTVTINNMALNSSLVSSGYTLPATTSNDIFIVKYDSSGTLVAFTALNGTGSDIGYSITTDSSGNMYVTGEYSSTGTVTINNMDLNSSLLSSGYTLPAANTGGSMFVLKYNSSGTLTAFTALVTTGRNITRNITVDSSGNIYVTGFYTSTGAVSINNLALNSSLVSSGYTLPAASAGSVFILKYNSSGTLAEFTGLDGTGTDISRGIAIDSSGNMYFTGIYVSTGTVPINNLALNSSLVSSVYTLPATSTGGAVFILKYGLTDQDQLVNLQLTLNSIDRITPDYATAQYLRVIQGLQFHTRVPNGRYYMYSFALEPELNEPSGEINMTNINRQQHTLTLAPSTSARSIRIYALSFNLFSVSKGNGVSLHTLQEG